MGNCRALTLDGVPCRRQINDMFIHCGYHGANPIIIDVFVGIHDDNVTHNNFIIADSINKDYIQLKNTIYNSAQTVHSSSIVSSTEYAISIILKHKKVTLSQALEFVIGEKITIFNFWKAYEIIKYRYLKNHIDSLINNENKIYNVLFKDVFLCGVGFALKQPEELRNLLKFRIRTEMKDGIGFCLQGNFGRFANAFSGLMEGVMIGISPKEQLQSQLSVISKNSNLDDNQKKIEAQKVLNELEIPISDHDAWLSAF